MFNALGPGCMDLPLAVFALLPTQIIIYRFVAATDNA
jgi:hypothetical protein